MAESTTFSSIRKPWSSASVYDTVLFVQIFTAQENSKTLDYEIFTCAKFSPITAIVKQTFGAEGQEQPRIFIAIFGSFPQCAQIVRGAWTDLRVMLSPTELRSLLKEARLITTAEYHELDPTMGLGLPSLNDRLLTYLSGTGPTGFTVFVGILQRFGDKYRDILVRLGQPTIPAPQRVSREGV